MCCSADDGGDGSLDRFKTKVVLSSDGKNMWLAPVILKSSCKMDVTWFPFDEQVQSIKLVGVSVELLDHPTMGRRFWTKGAGPVQYLPDSGA